MTAMALKLTTETRSEPTLYTLFGISCHLKDYRISFLLNRTLELEFSKMEDFLGSSLYFSDHEDGFNRFYLLANRNIENILLPELKQTDFLLLVEGPFKKAQKETLLQKIKSIQNILTAFEIRFETIKNYEHLLADLEMHTTNIRKVEKIKFSPTKKQEDPPC